MKSEANVEDLRNKVVSDGTMRPEDLIPKFLGVLKEYAPDRYDAYVKENPEVLDLKGMDDETLGFVVEELFDELDKIAPEGCIFGATCGDGACYGFWSVDADERKKCEAYIQPVTLYSTTRYDDAEAVQSFLRDIGGDAVTVDKQRNGDVLSVNVSGSDDDVEAFVDTYKNEYGSIVKDCEVDAMGWTAPEDIYYIATEQGRKELRGESKKFEVVDEEAFGKFEDAVKSILMDKYGVVDSHGPSDETANSLVLQYGATLRDAFDKGGENEYDSTSVALLIITRKLREAPQFFDDCKDFTFNKDSKKSESYQDWIAFYFCVDNRGDEYAVYPHDVHDRNGVKVVGLQSQYSPIGYHEAYKKDYILDVMKPIPLDEVENSAIYKKLADGEDRDIIALDKKDAERIMNASNPLSELNKVVQEYDIYKGEGIANVKKSESLTLKQKELKDMVRYGEAEDITTISDVEAKELYKKGLETVGLSRGIYGLNGALLRDSEGKKYAITARSSNLFYFI